MAKLPELKTEVALAQIKKTEEAVLAIPKTGLNQRQGSVDIIFGRC